jgi:hypothetical protein
MSNHTGVSAGDKNSSKGKPNENNKDKRPDPQDQVVGGFAFFLSLAALVPTGALFLVLAVLQIRHAEANMAIGFIGSLVLGAILAQSLIRGHLSVFLHEFKHALISNLVGNKNKRMKVGRNSGHLEYAYTKKTAHYNAFIALAPYIVPVCTFFSVLIAFFIARDHPLRVSIIIGLGYGADLLLNARDISPIQTDISLIRGGYKMGLLYILGWNMLTSAIILAWAFQGFNGVAELFAAVSKALFVVYFAISGKPPT